MPRLPADLPQRLRAAGLKVIEVPGWRGRGRDHDPVGVLNHHTGSKDVYDDLANDLSYAKWMFLEGRNDLSAPLCQLSISLEGNVYVGAAGRANHGGDARSSGSVAAGNANSLYVGIEWMLSGTQPIPREMYDVGATTNAVLLDILGSSTQAVSCHYNTSVTGKWDIGDPNGVLYKGHRVLDVPKFREAVQVQVNRLEGRKPITKPQPRPEVKDPEPKLTRGPMVDEAMARLRRAKPSRGNALRIEAALEALEKIQPWEE